MFIIIKSLVGCRFPQSVMIYFYLEDLNMVVKRFCAVLCGVFMLFGTPRCEAAISRSSYIAGGVANVVSGVVFSAFTVFCGFGFSVEEKKEDKLFAVALGCSAAIFAVKDFVSAAIMFKSGKTDDNAKADNQKQKDVKKDDKVVVKS